MCTLTWWRDARGFSLHFNRDERKTRPGATPPEFVTIDGVRALAPRDGEAGGTWIGVNERGVAVALLNGYQHARHRAEGAFRSRGLLVREQLGAASARKVADRVRVLDLPIYRPFLLTTFDRSTAFVIEWDGLRADARALDDGMRPMVSSGYDFEGVARMRRELFDSLAAEGVDDEMLARFHRSHEPERGPYSPCMHRDDAATVSYTRVTVDGSEGAIEYHAGAPCESPPRSRATLPLATAGPA